MTGGGRARGIASLALGGLLTLGLAGANGTFAQRARSEFTGSCYCRAGGELRCASDRTEDQCERQCAEELCDDWFWLERRPCWNWGYGG
ncbi:MAG: hypothetical protein DMD87_06365 [Candidatus Rokuibacteriota bacterium]|nr:MAG: hypothetical protein DMD87_06365 [Candidatus Rokubacteria bacterium]